MPLLRGLALELALEMLDSGDSPGVFGVTITSFEKTNQYEVFR
jgi:hypothetical protein